MTRLLDAKREKEDESSELTLRPQTLQEYVGQSEMKGNLSVFIQAAKARQEPRPRFAIRPARLRQNNDGLCDWK